MSSNTNSINEIAANMIDSIVSGSIDGELLEKAKQLVNDDTILPFHIPVSSIANAYLYKAGLVEEIKDDISEWILKSS